MDLFPDPTKTSMAGVCHPKAAEASTRPGYSMFTCRCLEGNHASREWSENGHVRNDTLEGKRRFGSAIRTIISCAIVVAANATSASHAFIDCRTAHELWGFTRISNSY